jgi:hypothetical protein
VPGAHGFRVYGYGTTDPLEEVPQPGYFALGRALLRPGELIYVSTQQRERRGNGEEPRMAVMMVRADERDPEVAGRSVRLVQDLGRPSDGAGALGRINSVGRPGATGTGQARPRPPARQPEQETGMISATAANRSQALRRGGGIPSRIRASPRWFHRRGAERAETSL